MVFPLLPKDAGYELLGYERRNEVVSFFASWLWSSLCDGKILSYFRVMKCILFMQYITCSIHPDAPTLVCTELATPCMWNREKKLVHMHVSLLAIRIYLPVHTNITPRGMMSSVDQLWAPPPPFTMLFSRWSSRSTTITARIYRASRSYALLFLCMVGMIFTSNYKLIKTNSWQKAS